METQTGGPDYESEDPKVGWGITLRQVITWAAVGLIVVVGIWLLDGGRPFSSGEASGETGDDPGAAPRIGRPAPDFVLNNLEGKPIRLSDFRGKTVFLNFWATWCPPCRAEMPDIERVYQEYTDKDVVVLAVNQREDPETVKRFMESLNLSLPVLLDSSGEVGRRYRVSGIPTSFFVDPKGVIREMNVGTMTRLGILAKLQMAR